MEGDYVRRRTRAAGYLIVRWSRLRAFARRWGRPASWERALQDEVQGYVQLEIDAKIRDGMAPAEARRTALAEFGGLEQVKERVRAEAAGAWLDTAYQDLRNAIRSLRHSPGYSLWVIASLAIGMAVAIAAFAFLNTLLFRPFPSVADQDSLVRVSVSRGCGRPDCWVRMTSPTDYAALREGLTSVQGLTGYALGELAVGLPEARSVRGALTSASYFVVLGVRPILGRAFDERDEDTRATVTVISHKMWTRDFAGDAAVIGRSIRVANEHVQIVGVAPPFFVGIDLRPARGDRGPDLWLPIWLADQVLPLTALEQRRQERDMYFAGRLRGGVGIEQVQAQAEVVAERLAAARGRASDGAAADVRHLSMSSPRGRPLAMIVVLPIPILVLVIACLNAANLMLARGSARRREIAIRLAIGAGRLRIVNHLLIESALLASVAAAAGLLLAWWALQLADTPVGVPIAIDGNVVALTVLTALGTAVAFGLVPAIRLSAPALSSTFAKPAARTDATPPQSRKRRLLLIAQVAVSLGLLATASQLVSTVRYQAVSGGTPGDRLLVARFDLRPLSASPSETQSFYARLAAGTRRLPGVEAVGLARAFAVWTFGHGDGSASLRVWYPTDRSEEQRMAAGGYAGGELFAAIGLRVLAGRLFSDAERQSRPEVAVVNQAFADAMSGPALGSVIRVAPPGLGFNASTPVRIVGIIEVTREPKYDAASRPAQKVYLPSPVEPEPALALYVRTHDDATVLAEPFRNLVSQIGPRIPILEIGSLNDFNERSFAPQLWLARAAAFLGVVGLLLATMGLYGVSSYVVSMQSREIAVRMAVGATPRRILGMVVGQSMRIAVIGLVLGVALALAANRVIQSEYHGIHGIDVAGMAAATALFLAAMLLASAVPALSASRVDPVAYLKDT